MHPWEKKSSGWSGWRRVLLWLILGIVGLGVVVATVAGIGFGYVCARYGGVANQFDLNDVQKMESASLIYDRNGQPMGEIFIQNRKPVTYREISPNLVKAIIAAEDNRFYEHDGVDWVGVIRAAMANFRSGRITQGASTVTQQLARNSFQMRERTYERKLVEMFLARRIEKVYSKEQIMELYLNRIYFGSGFYGAEAASRGYFGKPAIDLTPGEAAMLAGLLKSPQNLSPWNNHKGAREARNFVLRRMQEMGFLTSKEYKAASESPLDVLPRSNPHKVSYAIDWVRQQAVNVLGFERAANGGFQIYTTLDAPLQKAAENVLQQKLSEVEQRPGYEHETFADYHRRFSTLEDRVNRGDVSVKMPTPKYLQGAVLVVDNEKGGILAVVGGRDFRHSEYNRATQARRPAGTVFTPFVFASAFSHGYFPGSVVQDACLDNRYVMVGGDTGILGEWGVETKDNNYEGSISAREALYKGKNAATVRLGFELGMGDFKQTLREMGIESPIRDYANAFLGSSEVTLQELTLAYTVFPNLGVRSKELYVIQKIDDTRGNVVYEAKPKIVVALSRANAFETHLGLEDVFLKGVAHAAQTGLDTALVAGKPGTAYGFTDAYFIGYTSAITCGVWVGFDKPKQIYYGAFGSEVALPIWTDIINEANKEFPPNPIRRPYVLKTVELCHSSGLLATPFCVDKRKDPKTGEEEEVKTTYMEYATEEQMPQVRCDVHGDGIRSYTKGYEQDGWPRAASAIDLTHIRPITMQGPTLLGLNDVYRSVRPGQKRSADVPIAKAIPLATGPKQVADDAGIPIAAAIPVTDTDVPEETDPSGEIVRRAEPVTLPEAQVRHAAPVVPSSLERPVLQALPPEPVYFGGEDEE